MPIPQTLCLDRRRYVLWRDPEYSAITIATPDILEKSLMEAVDEGRAEYALPWYLKHYYPKKSPKRKFHELGCAIRALPDRMRRVQQFR